MLFPGWGSVCCYLGFVLLNHSLSNTKQLRIPQGLKTNQAIRVAETSPTAAWRVRSAHTSLVLLAAELRGGGSHPESRAVRVPAVLPQAPAGAPAGLPAGLRGRLREPLTWLCSWAWFSGVCVCLGSCWSHLTGWNVPEGEG